MKYPRITSVLVATAIALSGAVVAIGTAPSAGAATPAVAANIASRPTFTAQPRSTTAYAGTIARFSATAAGTNLSYRWQVKLAGKAWAPVSGNTWPSLRVVATPSRNKAQFRVIVRGAGGETISQAATLTVITLRPRITAQPQSASVTAGHTAVFHVSAIGYGVTYRWQWKSTGTAWQNLSGGTGASFVFTARTAYSGGQLRVIVRNAGGTVTSTTAKLIVNSTRPDPVRAGVSVRLANWQVKVEPTLTNDWALIHEYLTYAPPPAANHRYVTAFVDLRYVGPDSSYAAYDLKVEFVGGNGRVYTDTDKFYWTNNLYSVGEMFHNATANFATTVEVPTSAVAGGKWRITDHSATWPGTVAWFGLS